MRFWNPLYHAKGKKTNCRMEVDESTHAPIGKKRNRK
jgi:hypothetical protein